MFNSLFRTFSDSFALCFCILQSNAVLRWKYIISFPIRIEMPLELLVTQPIVLCSESAYILQESWYRLWLWKNWIYPILWTNVWATFKAIKTFSSFQVILEFCSEIILNTPILGIFNVFHSSEKYHIHSRQWLHQVRLFSI